jgi:hypothetical protein
MTPEPNRVIEQALERILDQLTSINERLKDVILILTETEAGEEQ